MSTAQLFNALFNAGLFVIAAEIGRFVGRPRAKPAGGARAAATAPPSAATTPSRTP